MVKSASNATIAVGVECVEGNACATIYAGVYLGASQNHITICIHNAGSSCRVCIDEIATCICGVIGSFGITITERVLDNGEGGYGILLTPKM